MMRSTVIFLSLLLACPLFINAQDADELLAKMDNVIFAPIDKQATVKMIMTKRDDSEKEKEAIMLQKGSDKKLYRYTKPESQAGIATLSLPGGEVWLYLPALGKPRKIAFLAKSQAFNNTDFSYEDMATSAYAERYTPTLVKRNPDSYVLELRPKDEKSEYLVIAATIDKTHFYPVKMEYYNKNGEKFKEAVYTYEKIGKYWNAKEVVMTDLKKDRSTTIQLTDVKFDQGLADDLFTVDNLQAGK